MGVVVVVDDDTDMADLVTYTLELSGHTVHTALDGATALSMVQKQHPDLVILDNQMPGMTGLQVAHAIRADVTIPPMPIVMISGSRFKETDGVIDKLIAKPMRPRALAAVMKEFLEPAVSRTEGRRQ